MKAAAEPWEVLMSKAMEVFEESRGGKTPPVVIRNHIAALNVYSHAIHHEHYEREWEWKVRNAKPIKPQRKRGR